MKMNSQESLTDQMAQLRSAAIKERLLYAVDWLDDRKKEIVPDRRRDRFTQICQLHPIAVQLGLYDADDFIMAKFRKEFI